jgi:predicted secreted protein
MSNSKAGVGTIFRRWSGSDWANIAEIKGITGPNKSRNVISVTSLDSTAGYEEIIAGLRKGGTAQLKMNFTRATYDLMNDDFESDVLQNYEIVLPDTENSTFEFEGLVTELGLAIVVDDVISSDVTISINGQVATNSGASSGLTP